MVLGCATYQTVLGCIILLLNVGINVSGRCCCEGSKLYLPTFISFVLVGAINEYLTSRRLVPSVERPVRSTTNLHPSNKSPSYLRWMEPV